MRNDSPQLPLGNHHVVVVQDVEVVFVTVRRNFAPVEGLQDLTARFVRVGTIAEPAMIVVFPQLREIVTNLLRLVLDESKFLDSGCVNDEAVTHRKHCGKGSSMLPLVMHFRYSADAQVQ